MSLSTAQPSLGGAPPTLGQHTIKFAATSHYLSKRRQRREEREYYADTRYASCEAMPQSFNRERRLSISLSNGSDNDDNEVPAVEVEIAKVHEVMHGQGSQSL